MDERYELIESYLQECVDNDIYTEDKANMILELAYDKYIIEKSESNNSSDLKERIKKNKKKIIALIALCTTTILIAKKMLKDDKIKKEQKKKIEMYLDMIIEENKKTKKLQGDIVDLELKVSALNNYNNKLTDHNKELTDHNKELKGSLDWRRKKEYEADELHNKMRSANNIRCNLSRKKDRLIQDPNNKDLMASIIKSEKRLAQREKEINDIRKKLDMTGIANSYAYTGIKKSIDDLNREERENPDKVKLD